MDMKATPCDLPQDSWLSKNLSTADFFDAYHIKSLNPNSTTTALQLWLQIMTKTPAWVDRMMAIRNSVVKRIGLKDIGGLNTFDRSKAANAYVVGDRVGAFVLLYQSPNEVVLGDSDKHLNVKISLMRDALGETITNATVVHINNWLGRVYMWVVAPMHRIIAPAVLSKLNVLEKK